MAKIQLIKCPFRLWTFSGSALLWLLASYPVTAQIVPDTTLPNNSIVTPNGKTSTITGGTQAGGNLFHSFKEFSILTGNEAFFNNAGNIQNIITRVTGVSKSNIDGLIKANRVNLFFINPNGIIFGPHASLDIGGSFVGSTANSLKFADGTEFSATNPQATPLLTVSVPTGLQFGSNPGEIVNQSQASLNGALNSNDLPAGLQVPSDKTLALVGGNVSLDGGNLTALGGRIELGSIGGGLVTLTEIPQGYALGGYTGIQNFRDIQLSNGAQVDTSGSRGGDIQVKGRNISLTDGAAIFSTTEGAGGGNLTVEAAESVYLGNNAGLSIDTSGTGSAGNLTITTRKLTVESGASVLTPSNGSGPAGNLLVKATDTVELSGIRSDGKSPSGLSAEVGSDMTGEGEISKGGNLRIETGKLIIKDGAVVNASTYVAATAANVLVIASNVELVGFAQTPKGIFPSSITTQVAEKAVENAGNAGNLTIETQRLTIRDGAQISTTGRKGGNGGDLSINASESIQLSGALPDATPRRGSSGIIVSAESPGATGNVGNLNITSPQITVENGAKIAAENEGTGLGGTLSLNVRKLTIQDGGSVQSGSFASGPGGTLTVNNAESVDVIGKGNINSNPVVSTLSAAATASGKAGDLRITTNKLNVRDGAAVTVSSIGLGDAGNLDVTANSILLNNGATLNADTKAGQGNIILRSGDLILNRDSKITTNAKGSKVNGGNININTDVLAAVENSKISADSTDAGGGRVFINTQGLFRSPDSTITATGATPQLNGTVQINTPDIDPSRGLVQLPTVTEVAPNLVSSGCAAASDNSFTITGRGGLPPSPSDPLTNDVVWTDARFPAVQQQHSSNKPKAKPHTKPKAEPIAIIPATGWVFNKEKGEVTLISSAPSATGLGSNPATCSTRHERIGQQ